MAKSKDRFYNPFDGSRKRSSPQIHKDLKDKYRQNTKNMSTKDFEEYIHNINLKRKKH